MGDSTIMSIPNLTTNEKNQMELSAGGSTNTQTHPMASVSNDSTGIGISKTDNHKIQDKNKQDSKSKSSSYGNDVPSKKNRKKVKEDEAFQRLNFLYQAGNVVMASCPDQPDIAAYYGNNLFSIAKKNLVKLQPSLKRTICKGCQSLLIPGVSARVRVRKRPSRCVLWTCIRCQTRRRFLTRPDYNLWPERPEAYVP